MTNIIIKNIVETPTDEPDIFIKTYTEYNLDTMKATKVTKKVLKLGITNRPDMWKFFNQNSDLHKRIEHRRKTWKPFGKALDKNNAECTYYDKDIFMEMVTPEKKKEVKKKKTIQPSKTKYKFSSKYSYTSKKKPKQTQQIASRSSKYVPSFLKDKSNKYVEELEKKRNSEFCEKKLVFKNVPKNFMEDDIMDYMEHIIDRNDISDIYILRDKYTGESRGMAFISCYKSRTCEKILVNFNNKPMGPLIIKMEYAKKKKDN